MLRRVLISLGILGLVLAVVIGGGLWFLTDRYARQHRPRRRRLRRPRRGRPPGAGHARSSRPGEDPVTFLLVGSDTRGETLAGEDPDGRSDAIMIARFSADRQHAQLISIPRDSWVDIPGHGKNKINASYAFGGPSLLIQTVEQLTDVRIDHYVAIDFDGIIQVTDDLGGVDVVVAETTTNGPYTFPAGLNHLDGDAGPLVPRPALRPARRRLRPREAAAAVPAGDVRQAVQRRHLHRPGRLDAALLAVTSAVSVDDGLGNGDLLSLAYSMRNVTPDNVDFFTAPVLGTGMEGAASVVYLDTVDRRAHVGATCAATRWRRTPTSSRSRRCPTSRAAHPPATRPYAGPSAGGNPDRDQCRGTGVRSEPAQQRHERRPVDRHAPRRRGAVRDVQEERRPGPRCAGPVVVDDGGVVVDGTGSVEVLAGRLVERAGAGRAAGVWLYSGLRTSETHQSATSTRR